MTWYTLNEDKTVTKLPDGEYPKIIEFKEPNKHVGHDIINNQRISTVFLHFDHGLNFGSTTEVYEPVLFETMIFGGPNDDYQRRYYTYNEALEGHNNIVKAIQEDKDPDFYFND